MVNLELLKKIQDLKESGQILELKDPNTGKLDDRLLSEVYHLYYNGYLHLPEYHKTLGFGNYKYLKKSFARRGWKTLSVKEVQQVYRSEIQDKIKQTNLERYGCENPSQSPAIQDKIKQTNLERYGYECAHQSDEVKSKIKQTNLERYGYSSPLGSPEVRKKIKQTNLERYGYSSPLGSPEVRKKIKQTNLEKYGVENPSQSPAIREKVKRTNLERYGYSSPFGSSDIKEKAKGTNLERYGVLYPLGSPEIQEKIRKTNLERYGVENPSQDPAIRQKLSQRLKSEEVQEKFKSTNLERYGHEYATQSPIIQEKIRKTNLERYGVENPSQDPAIREKMKQTNLERYGHEYASQSPEIQERVKQTNLKLLGYENPFKSPDIKEKIRQNNLERYGHENPFGSPEIQGKIKQTNIERYGYENPSQSPEVRQKLSQRLKSEEVQEKAKKTNLERYGHEYASQSPEFKEKIKSTRKSNDWRYAKLLDLVENEPDNASQFVIGNYTNQSKVLKRYGLYQENLSTPETAIREILENHQIEYLFRHRPKFMDGKELDFYIPNKNLAIEVNGLYWHSTKFRDRYYHQDKHLRCRSEGIQLLSFTEDQILEKSEIIESMILHKLGLTPYRVYAKRCDIRELSSKEAKDFLEDNHLHGFSNASVYLGLEYEGKLVHAMSFGNNRFKKSDHPELIRSASLRFHSVAGGFQRLLKYYKTTYKVGLVESYVDFNISNGNSYELASKGFEYSKEPTQPDLWFVFRGKRYYRQKFMKHNLHKIFKDFPKRSEEGYKEINASEYLRDRGVLEYYGAGNLKYLI